MIVTQVANPAMLNQMLQRALPLTVRQDRAHDLLLRTARPIKQVAEAVGFQNEKSFMRAFRGWSGQSATEFRRAAQP